MAGIVLAAGVYGVGWSIEKIRTHNKNRKARKSEYAAHFSEMEASNAERIRYLEAKRHGSPTTTTLTATHLVSVRGCQCQCYASHLHMQAALPKVHTCGTTHLHMSNSSSGRMHSSSCASSTQSDAGTITLSSQEDMIVPNGRMGDHRRLSDESVVYENQDEDEDSWPPPPEYEEVCSSRGAGTVTSTAVSGR